ncbi:MAG: Rdx family protein [Myxococcales bacterium]|nr:Rdx family protein [Myxococcales bacterium]MCH8131917.1 Rdx family protein [Myxococcales bacterium]TDJ15269.1 MAG: SelT/SelW/SelH family protein [Deltaproteobacteria bacterium]
MPKATSLAAAIQAEFGVDADLVQGESGVFDVTVDGRLIFSKDKTGRFPDDEEVLSQLR